MAQVATIGCQLAQMPKVKAWLPRLLSDHALANTWWNPADMPAWLTEEYYTKEIEPRLRHLKVREIANAIKVSQAYAALVRAGRRRPHPRHWHVLAEITGIAVDS